VILEPLVIGFAVSREPRKFLHAAAVIFTLVCLAHSVAASVIPMFPGILTIPFRSHWRHKACTLARGAEIRVMISHFRSLMRLSW
jgi:hypothetical protein